MSVEQSRGGSLSRLCSLSGKSRQAYYKQRIQQEDAPLQEDLIIQQVLGYRKLQPRIGGKKLYHLLKPFFALHRIKIGRDKFLALLTLYGLQIERRRRNKPRTTDSNHWMKKYDNLIKEWAPSGSNQLWVSDITYLKLEGKDAFLSLVTDAWSRKVVGFHVSESLKAEGCILALEMALAGCRKTKGLIHHSDRGVQYCCQAYVDILKEKKIKISMTQSGDPRDNAIAERVNGILKTELLEPVFADLEAARSGVERAINIYNYLRPHSSISMLTPALVHGKRLKLKRLWRSYYKKNRKPIASGQLSTKTDPV
ncbi:MAG TPA: IS3 family transposase [Mucilaginibacter sp.]|jgi:transposase InsO family protein|nr:IS3 family transposase [Mucilaginibacter sp.]